MKIKKTKTKKHTLDIVIIILLLALSIILYKNYELNRGVPTGGNTAVHFIDVGQADCVLIRSPKGTVLIDGGESTSSADVVDYLKTAGVQSIDYIIATHPHSDHIGGLPSIIREFEIGKIIMPDAVNTTAAFDRLLDAIEDKKLPIITPEAGDGFDLGDMKFLIIAPSSSEYDNLNDYSIGLKMTYGQTSFIFTGDAESQSESEIVSRGFDIKADVYKAGHHGSRTSSSDALLDAVDPEFCVISCGWDNDYGHPHKEVLNALAERDIQALRTDILGTIVVESDGRNLKIHTESGG